MLLNTIRFLSLYLIIGLYSIVTYGQVEVDVLPEGGIKFKTDSNYIGGFDQKLGVHFLTTRKFNRIRFNHRITNEDVDYNPSDNIKLGAGFFYKWIALSFSLQIPQTDEQIKNKGRTNSFDSQWNIFTRKFVIDGYLQDYEGYFLQNYEEYYPNRNVDIEGFPTREDIKTTSIGANFTWIFNNKKFSYKAAYVLNEIQKRNAGSFIAGGFYSGNFNSADSSFISKEIENTFGSIGGLEKLNTQSIGVTAGYARTFVIKKRFFLSFSLQLGPMINYSRLKMISQSETDSFERFGFKYILRGAVGYNHENFYIGLTGHEDSYSFVHDNFSYTYQLGAVKFFIGKRLNFNKSLTILKKKII